MVNNESIVDNLMFYIHCPVPKSLTHLQMRQTCSFYLLSFYLYYSFITIDKMINHNFKMLVLDVEKIEHVKNEVSLCFLSTLAIVPLASGFSLFVGTITIA